MTVIAIDGPAGSGKSTLARLLAERLGYAYLDTGAMYRAVAYLALRDGVALDDGASLAALARDAHIAFTTPGHIVAADRDVTEEIRRPAVSASVSEVSAHPEVRTVLLDEQRRIGSSQDVVIEGRDIGTVVFPEAPVKIFLTATPSVRAERRRKELIAGGEHVSADETLRAIVARDTYDAGRAVAPLRRADDAVELDTSGLDIAGVVQAAAAIVRSRLETPA
ncbi:MAG TPA: (d)CMP kinase [Thermoleophilia bacterium]|nr:(d)CMP kinase [Thermoleophilia bacterium]